MELHQWIRSRSHTIKDSKSTFSTTPVTKKGNDGSVKSYAQIGLQSEME